MGSTLQTFQYAIKDRYDKTSHVENLTMADRPLLTFLTKDEDLSGGSTHIPMTIGNPQGIAAGSLAEAQTAAANSNVRGSKFLISAGDLSASVDIGDRVIKESRNNPGAFLKNKAQEMDGLHSQMADDIATYCYGNGGLSLGVIASIDVAGGESGGDRIHLTEPTDTISFENTMLLTTATNDGSLGVDGSVDTNLVVDKVNRAEGYVDVTGTVTAVAGNWLFRSGSYGGVATVPGQLIFTGLQGFLWANDAPPDLYGMVRTVDPTRLAGCRVPDAQLAGLNIEERISKLGSYMSGRYKSKAVDKLFMNPEDWQNLATSLQSRGIRPLKDDTTRWNYMALETVFGGQMVRIYNDRYCPRGRLFALRMKNWKLYSMMKLVHTINEDGLTILRKNSKNDYEFRLQSYPVLCTDAPGYNGTLPLAS